MSIHQDLTYSMGEGISNENAIMKLAYGGGAIGTPLMDKNPKTEYDHTMLSQMVQP